MANLLVLSSHPSEFQQSLPVSLPSFARFHRYKLVSSLFFSCVSFFFLFLMQKIYYIRVVCCCCWFRSRSREVFFFHSNKIIVQPKPKKKKVNKIMCSCESFFVNLTMITSTIDNTCVSPLLLLLLLLVRRTGRHKTGLLMCEVGGPSR